MELPDSSSMHAGMIVSASHSQPKPGSAFTLLEVVLAIVIALGILLVVLYFYQQSTELRRQAIAEAEQIAAARLMMDRMTSDLATVPAELSLGRTFVGTSNSLQFVRTDVPTFSSWMGGALGRSAFPVTDLRWVRYRLQAVGTNAVGLVRSEEPLVLRRNRISPVEDEGGAAVDTSTAEPPALEEIQWVQFRYWSGTNWLDSWSSPLPPLGVEINLGPEVLTNQVEANEVPDNVFRRVVALTASGRAAPRPAASGQPQDASEESP